MHQCSITDFGRRIGVDTHPFLHASYVLPIRRYRNLQSRFLQSPDHSGQPCDLLNLQGVTPVIKRLSLSGN